MSVAFPAIEAAAALLAGHAHRTPVLTSHTVDARTGASVFFKCENFQRMGAFKFRGAYHALARLADDARRRGVVAYSSGNHAQAVALAGRLLGIPATIVMPSDAPQVKLEATRGYGARVVLYDRATQRREDIAAELADREGLTTIPPFDHPDIIAGQGTAALELLRETGPLDYLLVPCGGGGLLSGSAIAANACAPGIRVMGVEPAAGDDVTRSFHSGTLQSVDNPDTIADGARTQSAGRYTFPLIQSHVHDMLTVTDDELLRAMFFLMERMKFVLEPTGALGAAALLSGKVDARGKRVGIIVSGGNVDLFALAPYLAKGRAAYGA
ncbi:threo-3-hydroxy-L-aspartate ammonia-lyase [Pigmentiphaga sp. H8]|uniref:threo-3-hydroxy-L-aspartate ammonia-lyase n=1 Tax=Pigmentiphaga sp. H8 TaxID=2488560 RepID=UPI000F5A2AC7|nr:threo-3-hydroxy-L-aspartate ammonia-lyase [Pigmentiphaga sp. H8]AZG08105.1 threo-3-hydroxy-L-aspartate ammonia-lyase [Pigmentiphaga sp. H8]